MDVTRTYLYRSMAKHLTAHGKRQLRRYMRREIRETKAVLKTRLSDAFLGKKMSQLDPQEVKDLIVATLEERCSNTVRPGPESSLEMKNIIDKIGSRPIEVISIPRGFEIHAREV